jgi:hypothetical protein
MNTKNENRSVSFKLGIGIFFMPIIFAWWTLRNGHSKKARIISFVWMIVTIITMISDSNKNNNQVISEINDSKLIETVIDSESKSDVNVEKIHNHKLGEQFQIGGFSYIINDIEAVKSIGKRFLKEKEGEDAIFLVVSYTIENIGKETETVMSDDLKIVDNQERIFRPSSKGNTALSMVDESKDYILSEIQPGIKKNMLTVFEIPISVAREGVKLIIPEKGLFGTKQVEILLPKVSND